MSKEGRFALVDPADVVVGIDCSTFRPLTPIAEMKMAESCDGLRHVLELHDKRGASYLGALPYMAQVNPIGFLQREHAMLEARRTGYSTSKGPR